MKFKADDRSSNAERATPLKRRGLLLGVGVAGAAGAAAMATKGLAVAPAADVVASSTAADAGGYQLTAHVLRYYETTKI